MKYLNLIILLLFLLACQDKKKDRDQAFSIRMARKRDTISERHGLCTVCNRYGRLHPAKIPPQGAGFRGFHRMYQLQTPTAPMERTDSIHRLHYPRNGSLPLFLPVR